MYEVEWEEQHIHVLATDREPKLRLSLAFANSHTRSSSNNVFISCQWSFPSTFSYSHSHAYNYVCNMYSIIQVCYEAKSCKTKRCETVQKFLVVSKVLTEESPKRVTCCVCMCIDRWPDNKSMLYTYDTTYVWSLASGEDDAENRRWCEHRTVRD